VTDDEATHDPSHHASSARRDRGQATVEFAAALPLVVVVVLGIVQLVVVARDQLAVEVAARDAARAASVAATPAGAASQAAQRAITLRPLEVRTVAGTARVTVTVSATSTTDVPLIGAVIPDVTVSATVTMLRDPP
jgi:Flp pilus assembly protein TadG